jgi:hypothetical protein
MLIKEYVDRGNWLDELDRAVSGTFVNLGTIPRDNWFNHVAIKAIEGNYDTFSFQADAHYFLGNYGAVDANNPTRIYKYDKHE